MRPRLLASPLASPWRCPLAAHKSTLPRVGSRRGILCRISLHGRSRRVLVHNVAPPDGSSQVWVASEIILIHPAAWRLWGSNHPFRRYSCSSPGSSRSSPLGTAPHHSLLTGLHSSRGVQTHRCHVAQRPSWLFPPFYRRRLGPTHRVVAKLGVGGRVWTPNVTGAADKNYSP